MSNHAKSYIKQDIVMALKILLPIILLIAGLIGYGVYWLLYDMDRLPNGKYLTEETSPNGEYTLKAYFSSEGIATNSVHVRGELVFNKRNGKTKNIYWSQHERTADIKWIDNDTVVINGHKLNVPRDKFDFRYQ